MQLFRDMATRKCSRSLAINLRQLWPATYFAGRSTSALNPAPRPRLFPEYAARRNVHSDKCPTPSRNRTPASSPHNYPESAMVICAAIVTRAPDDGMESHTEINLSHRPTELTFS